MKRKYYKAIPRELSANGFWSLGMVVDEHYPCPPNDTPIIIEVEKEQIRSVLNE